MAAFILPIAGAAGTSTEPMLQPLSLYKVIFDRRFPSSRECAAEARSLGLPIHGIEGDITDVWFHDLSLRWKQEPALLRFHETVKDAVDPSGILSAGRYGIWPKHLRKARAREGFSSC